MYLDRGQDFGADDQRPGDDTDRFLEYWNHVFMAYELHEDGSLTDLPEKNIDTGHGARADGGDPAGRRLGLRHRPAGAADRARRGALGRAYGSDPKATRAMRIIADHARGTVNLIADGVVPSNEDRGYVLRRVMRRAIQQGRVLGLEAPYLGRFAERAIEMMAGAYPQLAAERGVDHALGRRRGGELRAHARPRHRAARRA